MVDSNYIDRIDDAREELHKMINHEKLKDAVILVYAKHEKMALHTIRSKTWNMQDACAIREMGFMKVLIGFQSM